MRLGLLQEGGGGRLYRLLSLDPLSTGIKYLENVVSVIATLFDSILYFIIAAARLREHKLLTVLLTSSGKINGSYQCTYLTIVMTYAFVHQRQWWRARGGPKQISIGCFVWGFFLPMIHHGRGLQLLRVDIQ